jgi:hypothetical protein
MQHVSPNWKYTSGSWWMEFKSTYDEKPQTINQLWVTTSQKRLFVLLSRASLSPCCSSVGLENLSVSVGDSTHHPIGQPEDLASAFLPVYGSNVTTHFRP